MKTFLTIVVTAVVTVLAIVMGGWLIGGGEDPAANAVKVRLEQPKHGDLVEIVAAPGTIEPKTKVSISARVSARITELPFDERDRVTKGDPEADPPVPASLLVRLDATDLEAALRSAKARRAARAGEIKVAEAAIASTLR